MREENTRAHFKSGHTRDDSRCQANKLEISSGIMPTFTIRNFRNETPSPSTRVDYIGGTITSIFRAERREKKRNKRVLREEEEKKISSPPRLSRALFPPL